MSTTLALLVGLVAMILLVLVLVPPALDRGGGHTEAAGKLAVTEVPLIVWHEDRIIWTAAKPPPPVVHNRWTGSALERDEAEAATSKWSGATYVRLSSISALQASGTGSPSTVTAGD